MSRHAIRITERLIPGTTLRTGQLVAYAGTIVALSRSYTTGRIIGPKRKLIVVDFGALGEFECKPENLVAVDA